MNALVPVLQKAGGTGILPVTLHRPGGTGILRVIVFVLRRRDDLQRSRGLSPAVRLLSSAQVSSRMGRRRSHDERS